MSDESATIKLVEIMDEAYQAIVKITALGCLDYVMLLTTFKLKYPTKSLSQASNTINQALNHTDIFIGGTRLEQIFRQKDPYLSQYATRLIIAVNKSDYLSGLSLEQSYNQLIEILKKAAHQLQLAGLPLNVQYLTSVMVDLLGHFTFNHDYELIFLCLYD